ncbi:hypothetical protein ACLOJK_028217 [Asimina triloba]
MHALADAHELSNGNGSLSLVTEPSLKQINKLLEAGDGARGKRSKPHFFLLKERGLEASGARDEVDGQPGTGASRVEFTTIGRRVVVPSMASALMATRGSVKGDGVRITEGAGRSVSKCARETGWVILFDLWTKDGVWDLSGKHRDRERGKKIRLVVLSRMTTGLLRDAFMSTLPEEARALG